MLSGAPEGAQRKGRRPRPSPHALDAGAGGPTPGRPRLTKIILAAAFDRAPRRSCLPERSGGWRDLPRPSRVAPRRRRLRGPKARSACGSQHTRVIHSFHRDVGSAFWTPSNSLKGRLRLSPSLRASLSLRTCAPTAPASSRSFGRRSRGALTCLPRVRGGCRAASSERRPRLRPYADCGRHSARRRGAERSHRRPCLAQKSKEAPSCQSRNLSAPGSTHPPSNTSNREPGLAADACGKLTARQPRERGVPRLK
jgi:hypothetical protein